MSTVILEERSTGTSHGRRRRDNNITTQAAQAILVAILSAIVVRFGLLPYAVLLVAAAFTLRATTTTLLRMAMASAAVPWTFAGVHGLPPSFASVPISMVAVAGCLGLVVASGDVTTRSDRAHTFLRPAGAIALAAGSLTIVTVTRSSVQGLRISLPWFVGTALLIVGLAAVRRHLITAIDLIGPLVVAQAAVAAWDVVQKRLAYAPLPGMAARSTAVLERGQYVNRFSGTLGDYELYGEITALCFSAAVALALTARSKRARAGWLAAAIPLGTAMLASGTRGSVVIVAIALGTFSVLRRRWRNPAILIAAVVVFVTVSGTSTTLVRLGLVHRGESLVQLLNRDSTWDQFFHMTRGDLWTAFGHGLSYPYHEIGTYPHSLPLYLLYAGGTVGTCLFFGGALWVAASLLREAVVTRHESVIITCSVFIAFLADQVKIEFPRVDSYVVTVFAFTLACMAALVDQTMNPRQERAVQSATAETIRAASTG